MALRLGKSVQVQSSPYDVGSQIGSLPSQNGVVGPEDTRRSKYCCLSTIPCLSLLGLAQHMLLELECNGYLP